MNYEEIKTIVENYDHFAVHFGFRNSEGEYITLVPRLSDEISDKISTIIINNIEFNEEKNHEVYNQIGALDDTVETSTINDYPIVNDLISAIGSVHTGEINAEDIQFLIYEVGLNDDKVFFLRRHNRLNAFRSKGFVARISQGYFDILEQNNFVGIDDKIDLVIKDNNIAIFYHTAFERIFNLSEGFISAAEEVVEHTLFDQKVEHFDQLKEDLLDNMNYVKRVSKLKDNGTSLLFLQNIDQTKRVIEEFNLDILANEEGKLIYRDKSQLGDFVNLMQDAYYKTLIGEGKGIDERRS